MSTVKEQAFQEMERLDKEMPGWRQRWIARELEKAAMYSADVGDDVIHAVTMALVNDIRDLDSAGICPVCEHEKDGD